MVLGIDVGGTSIKVGIVNAQGDIVEKDKFDTPPFVENGFTISLESLIERTLNKYPLIKGVGIGFPGLLSFDRKSVVFLPNVPGIRDLNIVDPINKKFPGLKVKIENDAKCAAMGEFKFGEMKGKENFIMITLGTGIGSGAIINGELFIGGRGNATEIGHMMVGERGTLETKIGMQGIISFATAEAKLHPDSMLNQMEISARNICDLAEKDDVVALNTLEYMGELLGKGIVTVVRVLDINQILIGGGISTGYDYFYPKMIEVIKGNLPDYYLKDLFIKRAYLKNDAGVLGAASLVL